ncbi:MAG: HAD-IIIA family hydrolase [Planctomycetota bacterium]|nr:HAD-IIIA family hydrolase [Planctomycetota bacterium]
MPPAIFFDRDDTLIECRAVTADGDLGDPALVALRPHALRVCRELKEAGYRLVVVSNQGGVARGKYAETDVQAVNSETNRLLHNLIDAFYFCPFHPKGTVPRYTREHPSRKPAPGMLLQAASDFTLDLETSWLIGDALRDCQAAHAAGVRSILLTHLLDKSALADLAQNPAVDHLAEDLPAAADIILHSKSQSPA